ncbi:hypothetical protein K456DRAFT_1771325 [Colletotrichum gloeosporioides 23]|nr:hypothetical protein K456DRAFT_1771325 [Colletotrichum gloeosporioides 23]
MEWAVDLGWITSEAGTPSQFLESSVTTVVDDLQKPISYKAASQIVSPANTQQPTDIVLANDTKSESSAVVTAPLSPSSTGRPRISASSQSLYGLRDAVCRLLGNHQQDIARALSVSEDKTPNASRTANPVPAGESDSYDGSWWMLESDAALQAYIAAFSDYFYSFIPKANIEARLKEARLPDASHLVHGFASAVIALGAYYHRQHGFAQQKKRSSCSHNADGGHLEDARASWRLRAALAFRGCVRGLPSQLLKLQASIASECDIPSLVTENVAIAAMHVRELDLAQIDAVDDESVLSWAYSYVLDVSYALHRGAPPVSHSEGNLLGIRSLAAVMHRCLRRQFNPRASHTYSSATVSPGSGRWQSHQKSQEQLRYWVELFPDLNLRITPGNNGYLPTSTARMAFCMYHRAVFLTHCPWIVAAVGFHADPVPEHGGVGDQDALGHGCCIRACLESAQQVIDAIPCFFFPADREVPGEHRRKAVALAGLCHGSLARISLDESDANSDGDGDGVDNSHGYSGQHPTLDRFSLLVSIADRCDPT